jgi:hypothetical protein
MKAKNLILIFFLIIIASNFLGCEYIHIDYKLKYSELIEKKITLDKKNLINIDNINGFVKVSTHDKEYISISAEKFSNKKSNLNLIKVKFDLREKGLYVYTKKSKKHLNFKVNYTVLIPKGLGKLEVSSTNGKIKANGDFNDVEFSTTNGAIKLYGIFNKINLTTTNGSIKVIQNNIINNNMNVSTTNGSIKLNLNKDSNFKINGRTTNGRISCDFPVKITKKITRSKINGQVGQGEYLIHLSTTNGNIKIIKSPVKK